MVGSDGLDGSDVQEIDADSSPAGWLDDVDVDVDVGLEQELARDLENARSIWEASLELVPLDEGISIGLAADGP